MTHRFGRSIQAVPLRASVSLLIFTLAVPKLAAQTPRLAVRVHTAADSLEVVKPVVAHVLKTLDWTLTPGATIFVGDRLAYAALDSVAGAKGFLLLLRPQFGLRIGIGCPFKLSDDSAELNEKAAAKGIGVGFRIFSLDDSTAIVGFAAGCGTGVAPLSAYATGGKFRLRRVISGQRFQLKQVSYDWVIESVIDSWVT